MVGGSSPMTLSLELNPIITLKVCTGLFYIEIISKYVCPETKKKKIKKIKGESLTTQLIEISVK